MFTFLGSASAATIMADLPMDGTDGSTVFTDTAGGAWTAFGSVQISTAQSVAGGTSGRFPGSGSSVRNNNASALYFSTQPFTIEFWILPDATYGSPMYLAGHSNPDGGKVSTYAWRTVRLLSGDSTAGSAGLCQPERRTWSQTDGGTWRCR